MEERVTSERVFTGRLLGVRKDTVRLVATGRTAVREVVEHPGAVAVVPVTGGGEVILVRQFRYAVGEVLLEIPAGTLRPGEAPADCARREVLEETGRKAARLEPLARVFSSPGFCDETLHIYLAEMEEPRPGDPPPSGAQPDDDEDIEVVVMPLEAAMTMALEGRFHDAKSVAGLLLAGPARGGMARGPAP